jgi:protein-S-isoprenylcysteine O-methyltransferase Ste14
MERKPIPSQAGASPSSEKRTLILRAVLQAALLPLLFGFVIFLPAATFSWPLAWALLATYAGGMLLMNLWLVMRHPGLARERLIIPRSSERWDLKLIQITNFLLLAVMLPLCGLDHRFEWSPAVPFTVSLAALLLFAVLFLFMGWAMSANDFFSSAVRLQNDRGQTVAAGGPYRIVRHPGYLVMIIQFLSIPVILGSVWALIPASMIGIVYGYRTSREDGMLQEKLAGYADYAKHVIFRLIPGIW